MLIFYDANGNPTHTFQGDIKLLGETPAPYIEVAMTPQDLGNLEDWAVTDGVLVRASMLGLIEDAVADVNQRVGSSRLKYITDIPAQGMIYLDKEAEAKAYLAVTPEPANADGYPWIKREVGVTGASPYEVAQVFVNMAAMWRIVGPELEGLRLEATDAVRTMTDPQELTAIMQTLTASLEYF